MPKLNKDQVAAAKAQGYEQKSTERKPLPLVDGKPWVYKLVACSVGATAKNPNKMQWTWELQLDARYHPEYCNGQYLEKVWYYTPVEGGQEWAIAKMFHAFGYEPETDTDEIINDEAPVLAYLATDVYQGKTKMVARRFAQHYEEEYPQAQGAQPPFGGSDDPYTPQAAAAVAAPAAAAPAASFAKPADDPWAAGPAQASPAGGGYGAGVPQQAAPAAAGDPEDTF
jgi:hypothetical protein